MSGKPELKPCENDMCGCYSTLSVFTYNCANLGQMLSNLHLCHRYAPIPKRADLAKPSEWISVRESLPDDSRDIVAIGEGYIEIGFRSGVDTDPELWADFHFAVSHWCELPANKPPAKETP